MGPEIVFLDQKSIVSEFEVQKPTKSPLRTPTIFYRAKEPFQVDIALQKNVLSCFDFTKLSFCI